MSESLLFATIGLGMLGFGLVTVFSILALRDQLREKRGKARDESAPSPDAARESVPAVSLRRDRLSGDLIVEVGGRRYARPEEIRDPAIWRALAAAHRDLAQWMPNSPPTSPASPTPAPAPSPRPEPASGDPALPPPNMNPFEQMRVLREQAKRRGPGPKSVVEQIDEVLQRRLAGTPYSAAGVRMAASPSGGVQIVVGGMAYDGIDAVPDSGVRSLIREAVKEWEAGTR